MEPVPPARQLCRGQACARALRARPRIRLGASPRSLPLGHQTPAARRCAQRDALPGTVRPARHALPHIGPRRAHPVCPPGNRRSAYAARRGIRTASTGSFAFRQPESGISHALYGHELYAPAGIVRQSLQRDGLRSIRSAAAEICILRRHAGNRWHNRSCRRPNRHVSDMQKPRKTPLYLLCTAICSDKRCGVAYDIS